jgi:hypothetical protein
LTAARAIIISRVAVALTPANRVSPAEHLVIRLRVASIT